MPSAYAKPNMKSPLWNRLTLQEPIKQALLCFKPLAIGNCVCKSSRRK